jgi:hypothetical protein
VGDHTTVAAVDRNYLDSSIFHGDESIERVPISPGIESTQINGVFAWSIGLKAPSQGQRAGWSVSLKNPCFSHAKEEYNVSGQSKSELVRNYMRY